MSVPHTPAPAFDAGEAEAILETFDRTTSRAGRWTMIAGLVISLSGPIWLVFFSGLVDVTSSQLWGAFLAVAAVFAVVWVVEPLTYFPILGPAAMYQAFMIGNISSKLLPSALVAQERIGAEPGTRRGDFAAVAAICGAAAVHLLSLFIFVGLLGTWMVGQLPPAIIESVRTFILPAVLGAVIVQLVITMRKPKVAAIALVVALFVEFLLKALVPGVVFYATAIAVILTVIVAWFTRDRHTDNDTKELVA